MLKNKRSPIAAADDRAEWGAFDPSTMGFALQQEWGRLTRGALSEQEEDSDGLRQQ